MNRVLTRKLALAISMAAMAVLAAAVLLWVWSNKCSLYRLHPEQQRRVAVAKLLSEKERPLANPTESLLSAPLSLVAWSALWLFLTAQGRIGPRRTLVSDTGLPTAVRRFPCFLSELLFLPAPANSGLLNHDS